MIGLMILVALVCWGLNHNRRRQLRPPAGDRDLQRLADELRARS
jgi:hypothetical protein